MAFWSRRSPESTGPEPEALLQTEQQKLAEATTPAERLALLKKTAKLRKQLMVPVKKGTLGTISAIAIAGHFVQNSTFREVIANDGTPAEAYSAMIKAEREANTSYVPLAPTTAQTVESAPPADLPPIAPALFGNKPTAAVDESAMFNNWPDNQQVDTESEIESETTPEPEAVAATAPQPEVPSIAPTPIHKRPEYDVPDESTMFSQWPDNQSAESDQSAAAEPKTSAPLPLSNDPMDESHMFRQWPDNQPAEAPIADITPATEIPIQRFANPEPVISSQTTASTESTLPNHSPDLEHQTPDNDSNFINTLATMDEFPAEQITTHFTHLIGTQKLSNLRQEWPHLSPSTRETILEQYQQTAPIFGPELPKIRRKEMPAHSSQSAIDRHIGSDITSVNLRRFISQNINGSLDKTDKFYPEIKPKVDVRTRQLLQDWPTMTPDQQRAALTDISTGKFVYDSYMGTAESGSADDQTASVNNEIHEPTAETIDHQVNIPSNVVPFSLDNIKPTVKESPSQKMHRLSQDRDRLVTEADSHDAENSSLDEETFEHRLNKLDQQAAAKYADFPGFEAYFKKHRHELYEKIANQDYQENGISQLIDSMVQRHLQEDAGSKTQPVISATETVTTDNNLDSSQEESHQNDDVTTLVADWQKQLNSESYQRQQQDREKERQRRDGREDDQAA